jgi:hypothetical protein
MNSGTNVQECDARMLNREQMRATKNKNLKLQRFQIFNDRFSFFVG